MGLVHWVNKLLSSRLRSTGSNFRAHIFFLFLNSVHFCVYYEVESAILFVKMLFVFLLNFMRPT
jgi:hypothetical protein